MGVDGQINRCCIARTAFAAGVAGEGFFLHPPVDPSFFVSLEGGGLSVGQPGFRAAFGKGPATAAGLYQKKFDSRTTHAIADSRYLFTSAQSSEMRQGDELGGWREGTSFGPGNGQTRFSCAHHSR